MLAREAPDGKKPLFGLFQLMRVEGQRLKGLFDAARGLVEFFHRPAQSRQRRVEPAFGAVGHPVEPAHGVAHRPLGPVIAQRLPGPLDVFADALGLLHHPALGIQFGILAGLRRQRVQLAHRMAQEILFLAHSGQRGFGPGQRLAGLRKCFPGAAGGRQLGLDPGKGIEDAAVATRVEQPPVIVLAVQFHQRLRELPQHLARTAAIVDPRRC